MNLEAIDPATMSDAADILGPVWDASRDHGLIYCLLGPGGSLPDLSPEIESRPRLIILGDDSAGSRGPDAFGADALRRTFAGPCGAIVSSGPGQADHFRAAAAAAVEQGRAAIVMTKAEHEFAWLRTIRRISAEAIVVVFTSQPAAWAPKGGAA